jgi:hypothetical protein
MIRAPECESDNRPHRSEAFGSGAQMLGPGAQRCSRRRGYPREYVQRALLTSRHRQRGARPPDRRQHPVRRGGAGPACAWEPPGRYYLLDRAMVSEIVIGLCHLPAAKLLTASKSVPTRTVRPPCPAKRSQLQHAITGSDCHEQRHWVPPGPHSIDAAQCREHWLACATALHTPRPPNPETQAGRGNPKPIGD